MQQLAEHGRFVEFPLPRRGLGFGQIRRLTRSRLPQGRRAVHGGEKSGQILRL
jgi:hypothetical protein